MKTILSKLILSLLMLGPLLIARQGICGGGGQIIVDSSWITARSTTLCYDKKPQDSCYNESKACRDEFEKGLTDLLNQTCPTQGGDWWCDPDPSKDLAKLNTYVDDFKQAKSFFTALKACGPSAPLCGDNTLNGDEECDDGNAQDGDGCSGKCQIEIPSDVDATCYQGRHDGACAQKKQACDQIQGDKNCPEQLNLCLQDSLKTCKKSSTTLADQNLGDPTSTKSKGCSLSPTAASPNFSFLIFTLMGLAPMAWFRMRKYQATAPIHAPGIPLPSPAFRKSLIESLKKRL